MSFKNRIKHIAENLSKQIQGDDGESASQSVGNSNKFYSRTQMVKPRPVFVTPANATWEYNPVDVMPDVNHGEVGGVRISDDYKSPSEKIDIEVQEMVEDLHTIQKAIFG